MTKIRRIVFTGGAVLALGMTGFGTAAADTGAGDVEAAQMCGNDRVCMWEDSGYGGDKWVDNALNACSQNMCDIDGWNGDNEISSVSNATGCTVRLFADDNWAGAYVNIPAHTDQDNLEPLGFDNNAESYQFIC